MLAQISPIEQIVSCDFGTKIDSSYVCYIDAASVITETLPITFIDENHIEGFNNSQVNIIISGSWIEHDVVIRVLTKEFVQHFENIQVINVGYTSLEKILSNAFEKCEKVEKFDASGNPRLILQSVPIFKKCTQLRKISFSYSGLEAISAIIFQGLNQLETLELEGNNFTTLDADLFMYTPNLKDLSLATNPLKEIPGSIFKNLT